jgi:hypothetical protein
VALVGKPKMTNDLQFQMRVSKEVLSVLDNWRRKQDPIPSRAQAIRDLILKTEKKKS